MGQPPDVVSAGAVVFRPGRQVLLVHRGRYDDWSFPKGKLDRGEHRTAAAVRELEEETGLRVRLGVPLGDQRYPVKDRMKTVHYWTGRVVGDDDVSRYALNDEIDGVAWVDVADARERLSYDYDRGTLDEALDRRRRTLPLVVLRHAKARARRTWRSADPLRPLLAAGREQADRLGPVLAAYDVRRVVSSDSIRCAETVAPYVRASGARLRLTDGLSEEAATEASVGRSVDRLLARMDAHGAGGLLCTHRPVLPRVFERLGVDDPALDPGEMLVVHLRKGTVRSTERHLVP
ncbi:NUDIX hydrolase [Nocardioides lianchengensis]|uniref:8-oxo-dGTP diphosphatase n=1 Tax=Nocardioides lianchengensis TaxID=1045774 RepID=A0A1G6XS06_9ACTN|nr:NUDIX hydrolase [Nocardioides lianchengensis]NYG13411.1 8-oxo-dGTP diphosphatase [Nocardioides lianchengensis]SDD80920.1 8-oxo-dGTP diphosphatase [Nocardioides lianchengensis]